MALVEPFRALRADAARAARVLAPPYDVVTTAEARALAAGNPDHFLHVSRAEIDLPDSTDPHDEAVYARAGENFARLQADGVLRRDAEPGFYVYRLATARHIQTGIAAAASVAAYNDNRIRRHELTRPDKETDRVRHIEAVNAQTGPVLCVYRDSTALAALIDSAVRAAPLFAVEDAAGVVHTIWRVDASERVAAFAAALNALDGLYIADGHHRTAAAARVAAARGPGSAQHFLTVAFPAGEMRILDYNRVVTDLNGATPDEFLRRVDAAFTRRRLDAARKPSAPQHLTMYLAGQWYELAPRALPPPGDPVAALDVSLLHGKLIEPILAVTDPRRDPRIDFVGGVRGLAVLEARVDGGAATVAFALYPTQIGELMAVADAGHVMPPKSTWFEPKLADGLISHVLD